MSHIISLKVTKFQQPLPITLGVADEKPEGGQKAPSLHDIGLNPYQAHMFLETKCANGLHGCYGNNCNHSNKGIVQ